MQFPGVLALDGVSMDARAGEVLAVVGENGAGKSTLLKLIAGLLTPTEGGLELADGAAILAPLLLRHPHDAQRHGIAMVHQELDLAEELDVAGAIFLGREPHRFGWIDRHALRTSARHWLARVGLDVAPSTRCGSLSIAQRQLVEIAKALSANARVLVLDEPTSSLSVHETARLLDILRDLRTQGVAIVFVSHHLDDVVRIADRAIVLRDGRMVGELEGNAIQRTTIESLMVGRQLASCTRRAPTPDGQIVLDVRGAITKHPRAAPISIALGAGEVVGLAGLVGSGRSALLEGIAGLSAMRGSVLLDGSPLGGAAPVRARAGVRFVPEDRARDGVLKRACVATNLSLSCIGIDGRRGWIDLARERRTVAHWIATLGVRPADATRTMGSLSGGNQQKVVIARALACAPRVLLLDEPTRGVDVGARADIHAAVRRAAADGAAVFCASSDIEELLLVTDRIIVMHDGRVAGTLATNDATEHAILRLALGPDRSAEAAA